MLSGKNMYTYLVRVQGNLASQETGNIGCTGKNKLCDCGKKEHERVHDGFEASNSLMLLSSGGRVHDPSLGTRWAFGTDMMSKMQ